MGTSASRIGLGHATRPAGRTSNVEPPGELLVVQDHVLPLHLSRAEQEPPLTC